MYNSMEITASTNIVGANNVTGANSIVIGNLTTGLSAEFVRELLAAKDRQINELLNIIERLTIEAKNTQEQTNQQIKG